MDSNHRRYNQQIYSLPHLATLEPTRRLDGEPWSISGLGRLASGGGRFFRWPEGGGRWSGAGGECVMRLSSANFGGVWKAVLKGVPEWVWRSQCATPSGRLC